MSKKDWEFSTGIAAFVTITVPIGLPILIFINRCRSAIRKNIDNAINSPDEATNKMLEYCNADNSMLINITTYSANFIGKHPYIWLSTFLIVALIVYYYRTK